ncbi:MAG TPA: hypothetical protein VEW93_10890 [Acidimicrobiales bacterium]|nr:hypothetical protein [Acidimicrobiales bacterium]
MPTTTGELAERLTRFCVETLEALERHHLPGWQIPRTFAGHEVGADVRADACFTLAHLADAGVAEVAGEPVDTVLTRLLGRVDGRSTHTFFSYRIAETLLRGGPFAGNRLAAGLDDGQRAELERAVDSSDWLELLDAKVLPRNYAAVLARCELGRHRLGLIDDTATLDRLVDRARKVLAGNPRRALDDSNDRIGRYDIYTADVWLFCEPLAPLLGPVWGEGLAAALDLVLLVGARDGSAVAWGRSVGDLSAALTLELGALALSEGHAGERDGVWLRRATDAAATVMAGFDPDGVSTAHRGRNQDSYRGPARRLQLTLDLLGKVAWAAGALGRAPADLQAAPIAEAYPEGDHWVSFEDGRPAGVWAHRSTGVDTVVPFVGTTRSHYLPALHQPGTWEVPVDRDLPCWTPLVVAGFRRHTAGGVPTSVVHEPGAVTVAWDGFPVSGKGLDGDDPGPPLPGTRTVRLAVEGRTVVVEDRLTFERPPTAVGLAVPEVAGRPLRVEWDCASPHLATAVTVEGLGEWRTPTGEIGRVHQIDLEPATELAYTARVTPLLRVASTEPDHHYSRSLYRPLADRAVIARRPPVGWRARPTDRLADADVLHLHWPEWLAFDDLDTHRAVIDRLADADVPVVWTAHNLTPHEKRPEAFDPIYQAWAGAVRGVIHHSAWGQERMRDRYRFRDDCLHQVIPHGHFGGLWARAGLPSRDEAEERLDLAPAALRIGVVGAPRAEKLVQVVIDAVAACRRDDVELVCWSLGPGDTVPDDPRITIAEPYAMVEPAAYATRLATCDVLALVFDPDGEMLGTGAAADAVGLGLPALRSDWGYLVEALGDAGLPAGHTVDSVAAAIDALTPETLDRARAAALARRADLDWAALADDTFALFEQAVLSRH